MGIRVHKDIGYFLSKKNSKNLLNQNFEEIIDNTYLLEKKFLEEILEELKKFDKNFYEIFELEEYLKKEKHFTTDFFQTIFDGDNQKGFLLTTPALEKACRYDDLIDYYEGIQSMKFKIKYLHSPIYPNDDYICLKVPELTQCDENQLEIGKKIKGSDLNHLYYYRKEQNTTHKEKESYLNWIKPLQGKEKYFTPYIHRMSFLFCKKLGILKNEDMDYIEFIQYLEPAIVTYWS
jgi:hypothetical protein